MSVAPTANTPFSRERILQLARTLPADLEVLSQLGEMLHDINAELDTIAGLLRRDAALAARIVRISNSPMFAGGGQIASVEEAVNRVGFSEILKLVGTASAARFCERPIEFYGLEAEKLRENMLFAAFAAEALATAAGLDARAAYTAGLLRTLGIMVLDRACRGQVQPGRAYTAGKWNTYSAWEGSIFGVNNCEVTALVLDEWRFPTELGGAIRTHYLARPGDYEHPLGVILNLANGLAQRVDRGFAGEAVWWEVTPAKLGAAGLADEQLDEAAQSAEAAFDTANAALMA